MKSIVSVCPILAANMFQSKEFKCQFIHLIAQISTDNRSTLRMLKKGTIPSKIKNFVSKALLRELTKYQHMYQLPKFIKGIHGP